MLSPKHVAPTLDRPDNLKPRRLIRPSASQSWKMAFVIFTCAGLAVYAAFVRSDWLSTQEQSRRVAEATASLIAGHAASAFTQTIDALNLLAGRIVSARDFEAERQDLHREFAVFVAASEPVGSLWSVDASGLPLLDDSTPRPVHPPVVHRHYYLAHARGADVFIGERQMGTVARRMRFTLSKRLSDGSGRFAGAVVAGMDTLYFERLYEFSARASGTDAMMVREDGAILASWPGDSAFDYEPDWIGRAAERPHSAERAQQILRVQRVADLPVYVIARLDAGAAVRDWQRRAVLALIPLLVSIAAFAWLTRRGLQTTAEIEAARQGLERRVADRTAELSTLYQELNHRVKNNLQLVSALIRVGGAGIADPQAVQQLKQTSQRIEALADVHRLLENVAGSVAVEPFCRRIAGRLRDSFASPGQSIAVEIDVPADLTLPSDAAVAFGVAVNEIVTNAFKHAFAGRAAGRLKIAYTADTLRHHFTVGDDGVGLPPDAERSTGSRVVDAMIGKLDGRLTTTPLAEGTAVTISFPKAPPKEPLESDEPHSGNGVEHGNSTNGRALPANGPRQAAAPVSGPAEGRIE